LGREKKKEKIKGNKDPSYDKKGNKEVWGIRRNSKRQEVLSKSLNDLIRRVGKRSSNTPASEHWSHTTNRGIGRRRGFLK